MNLPDLSQYESQMQKLNSLLRVVVSTQNTQLGLATKDFGKAAISIRGLVADVKNLGSAFGKTNSEIGKLGSNFEKLKHSNMQASLMIEAQFNKIFNLATSIPQRLSRAVSQGLEDEMQRIAASSSIMRSGYAQSITEGLDIAAKVRRDVTKASAPLPGNTKTHIEVMNNVVGEAMMMGNMAGKSKTESEAFATKVSGQIGAIGGTFGANSHSTLAFANSLMSGSLSPNSQLELVQRNPMLKNAIISTMREYGADSFSQVDPRRRMEAMNKILDKSMPKTQLDAASKSLQGAIESFRTSTQFLGDFTRQIGTHRRLELTVYNEIKGLLINLLDPMAKFMEAFQGNQFLDPLKYALDAVGSFRSYMGDTSRSANSMKGTDLATAAKEFGFVDMMKWVGANAGEILNKTTSGERRFVGVDNNTLGQTYVERILNALQVKFESGFGDFTADLRKTLKMSNLVSNLDLGGSIGRIIGQVANSLIFSFNKLLPILLEQARSFFNSFKRMLDIVQLAEFGKGLSYIFSIMAEMPQKIMGSMDILTSGFTKLNDKVQQVSGFLEKASKILVMFSVAAASAIGSSAFSRVQAAGARGLSSVADYMGMSGTAASLTGLADRSDASRVRISRLMEARRRREAAGQLTPELAARYDENIQKQRVGLSSIAGRNNTASNTINRIFNPFNWLNFNNSTGGNNLPPGHDKFGLIGFGSRVSRMSTGIGMAGMMMGMPGLGMATALGGTAISAIGGLTTPGSIGRIGANLGNTPVIGGALKGLFDLFTNLGKMVFKIPIPWVTAIFANLNLFLGWFAVIGVILHQAYRASPELQKAVTNFLNTVRAIFTGVTRAFVPLYKIVEPVFKVIGDFLALLLNYFTGLMQLLTGVNPETNEYANNKPAMTKEEAIKITTDRRDAESKEKEDDITQGKVNQVRTAAYKGYTPSLLAIGGHAAEGKNVAELMRTSIIESAKAPFGSQLIVANSSETILTKEQTESARLSRTSGAIFNIPAINISVTMGNNNNPEEVANVVATEIIRRMKNINN